VSDADLEREIRVSRDAGVVTLTIDRPAVRNAVSWRHRDRLIEVLADIAVDASVRAVVLTGAGGAFCAGGDLSTVRPLPPPVEGQPDRIAGAVTASVRSAQALIAAVLDCPKPIVAAVDGVAAGMGAQLALACDVLVVAETCRLAEVFVRRAIVPDGAAAYVLARSLPLHVAKRLLLFGGELTAADLDRFGVAHQVVPPADLAATAAAVAGELAQGPTVALGLTKRLLHRAMEQGRTAAFDDEALSQEVNVATLDAAEGLASFRERRQPLFRGW
jgi:2-(1,2-epoxy-1,2-dihydrophenyl)acetyl-CoA isomerase